MNAYKEQFAHQNDSILIESRQLFIPILSQYIKLWSRWAMQEGTDVLGFFFFACSAGTTNPTQGFSFPFLPPPPPPRDKAISDPLSIV